MADNNKETADQIRAQMRGIRRDLRANVKGMVENASQMFDWKSYVRSFPWASLAIAGVMGYLIVPRRMKVIAYDKETLENFLHEKKLIAEPAPVEPVKSSLINSALALAGGVALKFAMSYATKAGLEMITKMVGEPVDNPPMADQINRMRTNGFSCARKAERGENR